jgi:hypothetical protein
MYIAAEYECIGVLSVSFFSRYFARPISDAVSLVPEILPETANEVPIIQSPSIEPPPLDKLLPLAARLEVTKGQLRRHQQMLDDHIESLRRSGGVGLSLGKKR